MYAKDKRINGYGNAVFDIYRPLGNGFDHFMATVEVRADAHNGLKVLLGALTPTGKERVWKAIHAYEFPK